MELLLMITLTGPLALGLGAMIPAFSRAIFKLAPLVALPAVLLAGIACWNVAPFNGPLRETLNPAGPGPEMAVFAHLSWPDIFLGASFALNEQNLAWLFFTALLWFAAAWYGGYYLAHDEKRGRYAFFFLGAMAGNIGLVLARDPVSFFTCFALMSFMSYGLVIHDGKPASMTAGRVYLGMAVLGEVLQFAGLSLSLLPMIGTSTDLKFQSLELFSSGNGVVTGLFIAGFGIKAGLFGLHVWLPMAHPVAPTPASAVLSGSMIKAGLIGWINLLPLGVIALPWASHLMVILGLTGAIGAALIGVTQTHPKAVLAYSSVSQMGLIITAIGIALGAPHSWELMRNVVALYAIHHAFAKCLLFFSVGLKTVRPLIGGEKALYWGGTLFTALALIGAPLTSGALAKAALKDAVASSGLPSAALIVTVLSLAAAGTTLLMIRYLITLRRIGHDEHHAAPAGIMGPWLLLLTGVLGGSLFMAFILFDAQFLGTLPFAAWIKNLWPLALGAALYAGGALVWRRNQYPALQPAPGDLYHGYAIAGRLLLHGFSVLTRWTPAQPKGTTPTIRAMSAPLLNALARAESSLAVWRIGGRVTVITAVVLFWLALM